MSFKVTDKKKRDIPVYRYRKIEIQCPDCGKIFIFNDEGECFCEKCKRLFSNEEIRARCGL